LLSFTEPDDDLLKAKNGTFRCVYTTKTEAVLDGCNTFDALMFTTSDMEET
jgi:hypothetical protein